jgi:hypothetical protein
MFHGLHPWLLKGDPVGINCYENHFYSIFYLGLWADTFFQHLLGLSVVVPPQSLL